MCPLPNSYLEALTSTAVAFDNGGLLAGKIVLDETMRVGLHRLVSLQEEEDRQEFTLSPPCETTARRLPICMPGRRLSSGIN